ncbi:hypothetical protein H6H03_15010 [Nostoc paludosum FACHB-159]|uniref:Uncharacterized protein n=2 Tax=Nostoc paludosum TaxID=212362 RepID=A0ABR8K6T2_9NOSO|nr:hypothetical protein [Nostoc paludosum FACHB-159]
MGHGAWGIGHGAWGIGHWALGIADESLTGLTQNHQKTNHRGRRGHGEIRVRESSCVSPI